MKRFFQQLWQEKGAIPLLLLYLLLALYLVLGILVRGILSPIKEWIWPSEPTGTQEGAYCVWQTQDPREYLRQLQVLDDEKVKILDISCGEDEGETFYIITYRTEP